MSKQAALTGDSGAAPDIVKGWIKVNRIAPTQTTKMRKVGEIRRKAVALFMSVLLAVTCLPILPGSVQEAHAETVSTSTYTHDGYITKLYASNASPSMVNELRVGYTYKGSNHYMAVATGVTWGACSGSYTFTMTGYRINGVENPTITISASQDLAGGLSFPNFNYHVSASVGGAGSYSNSIQANGSLSAVQVNCNIAVEKITPSTQTYPPTITAPNYEDVLGGPAPKYNYTENVIGKYGYTTSKTFGNGNTTNGTITWTTGTTGLTSNMTTFNKIGVEPHAYLARDTSDNTTATGSRLVISKLGYNLDLEGEYASGSNTGSAYDVTDAALEDGWTKEDVKVTTEIPLFNGSPVQGNYVLALQSGGLLNSGNSDTYSHVITSDFNALSKATLTGAAPYTSIELASPETMPVKVDKTNPVANASVSTSGYTVSITDASSDALSGLSALPANATKYALVDKGTVPTDAEYTTSTSITASGVGTYELWVWAIDKATNETKAKSTAGDIVIASTDPATIDGKTAGPDTTDVPLASGTWTNQNVKVTVTPPVPDIGGVYYSALYEVSPAPGQTAKEATAKIPVEHTYVGETPSTIYEGVMVDALDVALSGVSTQYEVKIDQTIPVGNLSFNAGVPDWGFTDTSTDVNSPVSANSGIDMVPATTKTIVCVVPSGDPQPAKGSYVSIVGEELPATGWYDVWVIATDRAGNESVPVKALEHISRSGLDEIKAKDFSWDIAAGSALLDDAMSIMLGRVEGAPYGSSTPFVSTDFIVDPAELGAIKTAINNGEKGTSWPLTFYTPNSPTQAQTTITVTIFDSGSIVPPPPGPLTQELIYANNFNWGISTGSISDASAQIASMVKGYKANGDLFATGDILVDSSQLALINAAITGKQKDTTWPLTFMTDGSTGTAATVTINVTLFDNGPANPPAAGDEQIVGNNFAWGISTGAISDAEIFFLGHVQATSATGAPMANSTVSVDPSDMADLNAAIAAGKQGTVWPVTVTTDGSTGTAASAVVYVTLYDAGPGVVPVAGAEHIVGNNFNWGISTGNLDETTSFILSQAYASNGNGQQMDVNTEATADPTDLAAINAAVAAGQKGTTWPLTLTTKGNTGTPASAVVYVTLYDNGPAGPIPAGSEHIVGNDFNWGISTGSLTESDAHVLSLLKATDANGLDMALSTVSANTAELDAINAAIAAGKKNTTWPLTFTTDGSTGTAASVTIKVTLYDNGPAGPIPAGSEHIVGNNFNWGIDSGNVSDAIAQHLGKVTATGANGLPLPASALSLDASELAALNAAIAAGKVGTTWPLTYTTDGSTGTPASVTIYVTLYDAGHQTPVAGDPYIVANHFTRAVSAGALDDDTAKSHSLVNALSSLGHTGEMAHITVDATELAAINASIAAADISQPPYPLTFTYTCPASSKTVSAVALVTLTGDPDLVVTKTVDNANPLPGDTVTYTIKAKNNGNTAINGLWIKDNLPKGTIFVSCDAQGKYGATLAGQEYVHWYVASLGVGAEVTFTVKAKIDTCAPGTEIKNIALYEDGKSGLPTNLDDNPTGGKTDPATLTVGDPGSKTPGGKDTAGKKLLKTGDTVSLAVLGGTILMAFLVVMIARRRNKKGGQ